ncbi:schlafen family member 13-like [Eublepharis macularius]|uniref:Schlafen family member 13-like n=1 Tax=Eublepharis macularius TaxID=481883 RepID=A0AA97LLR1_EUBMA|nr:schlafen family member 13-like [Eublepharis macularius]
MATTESQLHLDLETDYAEVVISVGKITFGELQRNKKCPKEMQRDSLGEIENEIPLNAKTGTVEGKKKGDEQRKLKEKQDDVLKLMRAACALLNSGGGVIQASIANQGYSSVRDGIGQDIQKALQECIHFEELSEYFDFIEEDHHMMIWVKSWSSVNSSKPRICSVATGLHQLNGESAVKRKDLTFLKEKLASAKREPKDQTNPKRPRLLINIQGSAGVAVEMVDGMQEAAAQFFNRDQLEYGEILDFSKWTVAEFKVFPTDKQSYEFVRITVARYASIFANIKGGYLIFGVDNSRKVVGCKRNVKPMQVKEVVATTIDTIPYFPLCASKPKVNYEFKAQAVYDKYGEGRGYVFVVKIEPFDGIVFSEKPDSWTVEGDHLKRLEIAEWLQMMTAEDPAESNRMMFVPQPLCDKLFLEYPGLKALLEREIQTSVQGILMFSRSWAVDIGLPKNRAIVCDAFLMAVGRHPILYTIVEDPTSDVFEHSRHTARLLKQKLVNIGGYAQRICVIPKILNLHHNNLQNAGDERLKYPKDYSLRQEHLPSLQKSLAAVLLGFTSFLSDFIGVEFLNLLTLEQYENLSKRLDETRLHFIYGIPGSGKTVVALKIIEKIKNEFGCQPHEILYICENKPLQDFVGQKMYNAVTRTTFMKEEFPNVKHIVVDEAQNFRVENGQWYKKASSIVTRDPENPGIFWIFLDYFQMSHPYETGLPRPTQQYPKDFLTKGVRNASQIYEVVRLEMEKIVQTKCLNIPYPQLKKLLDRACCSNSVVGHCLIKPEMEVQEMARYVAGQCQIYLDRGYSKKDIAILCSTKELASKYLHVLKQEMRKKRLDVCFVPANEILKDEIVLDSIRRFSGLERTIVFAVNPVSSQQEVSHNLLLCAASRANKQLHLLHEKEQVL